ncbi:NRPS-like enzyme [Penicillium angulare]|uniref:NRPS-like enzyme n=1 Tax=Penicillium angulare TaxID=116970 RepID=A0A9W9JW04_9EURO|nr:NRPS-like enzyme [Penicillium angulare]
MGSLEVDRLLTDIADELAHDSPDTIYCIHECPGDDLSWQQITYGLLTKAVDRIAWWIDENIPRSKKGQVLAYIGANDLRYAVFILACMKTRNKALLLSTRNSQAASRSLLQETNCSIIIDGTEKPLMRQMVDDLETSCTDFSLRRLLIGSMREIFSPDPIERYSQKGTFAELEDSTVLIIHSSGTTGNPKPVYLSNGYIATFDRMRRLPVPSGRQSSHLFVRSQGDLRFMYGPLFHFVGIACIFECIFYQTPFLLAPDRPMTSSLFSQIMNLETPPTWAMVTPSLMEDMSASEEGRNALAKMSALNYGGAPVRRAAGEKVASLLKLQTMLASSETAYTPTLLCEDPADWNFLEWNPSFELRMEEVDDGLYELVIPRPSSRHHHAIFYSHPHLKEYRTGDLFRPHPSKSGLWHYECRGDDVIVLSNGEKFNPTQAEKHIQTHPLVKYAAIFGQKRFQPAALIEPIWEQLEEDWSPENLKQDLLTVVNEANEFLPAYGKLFESHLVFASRDKPFSLSPKATLCRRVIEKDYQDVIDGLYDSGEPTSSEETPQANGINGVQCAESSEDLTGSTVAEIQQWVLIQVRSLLKYDAVALDDDLFEVGMDSLQAVRLTQILQTGVEKSQRKSHRIPRWTSTLIYDQSTVRKLADTVHRQTCGDELAESVESPVSWPREDVISKAIWQQAQFMRGGSTVALTGSTGELGSYLLDVLLKDPSIHRIYCLNRTDDATARQLLSFQKKKLASIWLTETSRVRFWSIDLEEEYLGLSLSDYETIQGVNKFIHNAWPVNFDQPLSSFEPQLVGIRHLLRLITKADRHPQFHFVSSISTVSGPSPRSETLISKRNPHSPPSSPYLYSGPRHNGLYPRIETGIPERILDSSFTLPYGYAESKFVAETLCKIAAKRSEAYIAIHRVGQLGGPSNPTAGMWNARDWFPSLIRTSETMKMLPSSLGPLRIDWLPIDTAAQILKEIIVPVDTQPHVGYSPGYRGGPSVFHICNAHATDWASLLPTIEKACNARVVPLDTWVAALETYASDQALKSVELNNVPALALLNFFRMLATDQNRTHPSFETAKTDERSTTFHLVKPVDNNLMETWLKQLKSWIPELNI